MYRQTTRSREQIARMIAARNQRRIEQPAPDYPAVLPDLRRRIVVEDFDFGHRVHVIELRNRREVAQNQCVAGSWITDNPMRTGLYPCGAGPELLTAI